MAAPGDHPVCLSRRSRHAVRPAVSLHAAALRHRRCGREGSRHRLLPEPKRSRARGSEPRPGQDRHLEPPHGAPQDANVAPLYPGFSASRKDIAPVVESIAGTLGANAFLTRLAAHGRATSAEFATVTPQDWLNDAREALAIGRRIGDRVILIGTSTGALLVTMVAIEDNSPDMRPWCCCRRISRSETGGRDSSPDRSAACSRGLLIGEEYSFHPDSSGHAEFWTTHYPSQAIVALMDLLNHARSVHLGTLKMPILIIYTDQDMVVDTAAIQARFDEIQGPAKLIVDLPEASRHELTGDALASETVRPVVQRILKFLAETDVAGTTIATPSR